MNIKSSMYLTITSFIEILKLINTPNRSKESKLFPLIWPQHNAVTLISTLCSLLPACCQ